MKTYQFTEAQERMLRAIVTAYHDALRRHQVGEVERQAKLDVSAELLALVRSGGIEQPKIVIDIEGGSVRGVTSDLQVSVLVVDGDTNGCDEAAIAEVPHRDGAVVFQDIAPECQPQLCDALFAQAARHGHHEQITPLAPHQ